MEREERKRVLLDDIVPAEHPTKTSRVLNKVVIGGLLLAALGLGLLLLWSLQSTRVLDIRNAPFPIRTIREHPTPDGVVILSVDYCKLQDVPGQVRTSYVSNSREIFLPLGDEKTPKGCHNSEYPVLIPVSTPPDTYRIKFHVVYRLNPLKPTVVEEFESAPFVVVAPGGPGSEKISH
jgi:hypothetical protein